MMTRQSNNILPVVHRLITMHYGENYWINGAAAYVMECLGEKDYDYWLIAALTGDNFAQVYGRGHFQGDGAADYRHGDAECPGYLESVFRKLGYAGTFVSNRALKANREMYLSTVMAYIDRGVPVMRLHFGWGVIVGYEDYGKTLLWMTSDHEEPEKLSADALFQLPEGFTEEIEAQGNWGWFFTGEKLESRPLADVVRGIVRDLPGILRTDNPRYCFGASAFRAWADDIESGALDSVSPEAFDAWAMYTVYVCNLATNGSCCHSFLERAMALDPALGYLQGVSDAYREIADLWKDREGFNLEALGAGFNVTLDALKDVEKRREIAKVVRAMADCADRALEILESHNA